jgi:hypothetical protein
MIEYDQEMSGGFVMSVREHIWGCVRSLGVCQVVVSGVVAISNKSELLTWTSDLEVCLTILEIPECHL